MAAGKVDKKLLMGSGISIFFLVLLFRQIDVGKLLEDFRSMDWRYLTAAVALTVVSYWLRPVRWHYLVLPLKRAGFGNLTAATMIGYMANNLLPARLGEFIRAYLLAREERLETSAVFATLVMDRLWDVFSVLLIMVATFFMVKLPPGMESMQHGLVMGSVGFFAGIILFFIMLKRLTARTLHLVGIIMKPFPRTWSEKLIPMLGSFIGGFRFSASPGYWLALILSSAAIWVTATWPIDLMLKAFGIHLPFTASMLVMVFLVFAVMVPASPGSVGTYDAACMYGLMAFNVPKQKALSIALASHAVSVLPTIVLGFFFLWYNKLSLKDLSARSHNEE